MLRQAVIATFGALSVAAVSFAGPEIQPPIGPTDQFDVGLNPSIDEPGIPGRTPAVVEQGPGPGPGQGTPAVPLPGPALMGAVGLGALLSIRRRWSDRD